MLLFPIFESLSGIHFQDLSGTERSVAMQEGSVERFEHLFEREAKVWHMEQARLGESGEKVRSRADLPAPIYGSIDHIYI